MLQARYPEETFRDRPVPLNLGSLVHDLILTGAMTALTERHPSGKIVHGKLLESEHPGRRRCPDAVLDFPEEGGRVAVELELTAKSEKRYRAIIFHYRQDQRYHRVLYVVRGRSIEDKIRRVITGRRSVPGLPDPGMGKFEFVTLNDLLNAKETV